MKEYRCPSHRDTVLLAREMTYFNQKRHDEVGTYLAKQFLEYYAIQAGLKGWYFFWISNLVVGVAITCYILQMYVSNRYRVRVLWRWLVSVGLCCLASVSLVAKVQGAAMWNLVFEPLTTFTKADYCGYSCIEEYGS